MSSRQVSFKSFVDLEQAVSYLEDLAGSLREGRVYVRQGDEFVELAPTDGMELELEAAEKKGKQKLTLELSWRRVAEGTTETGGLTISSTKPELPVTEPEAGDAASEDAGEDGP